MISTLLFLLLLSQGIPNEQRLNQHRVTSRNSPAPEPGAENEKGRAPREPSRGALPVCLLRAAGARPATQSRPAAARASCTSPIVSILARTAATSSAVYGSKSAGRFASLPHAVIT